MGVIPLLWHVSFIRFGMSKDGTCSPDGIGGTECVNSDVDVVAPAGSGEGGQSRQGAAILSSEQKRCYLLYAGDEILPSFIRIIYMIVYIYMYKRKPSSNGIQSA